MISAGAVGAPLMSTEHSPLLTGLPPVPAFNLLPEVTLGLRRHTLGLHASQAGSAEKSVLSEAGQTRSGCLRIRPPPLPAGVALRGLLCLSQSSHVRLSSTSRSRNWQRMYPSLVSIPSSHFPTRLPVFLGITFK